MPSISNQAHPKRTPMASGSGWGHSGYFDLVHKVALSTTRLWAPSLRRGQKVRRPAGIEAHILAPGVKFRECETMLFASTNLELFAQSVCHCRLQQTSADGIVTCSLWQLGNPRTGPKDPP